MFVMAYNCYKTLKMPEGKPVDVADPTDHEPSVEKPSTANV
jgi:cytochrome c oxidase cbb3-type subunit 1